jgi:hypothetical protein
MAIWRTGKPRSGIERDATINKLGVKSRESVYDYRVAEFLEELLIVNKLMVLHLQAMSDEEFKEYDTKDIY